MWHHKILLAAILVTLCTWVLGEEKPWKIYPSLGIDMGGAIPIPLSDLPEEYKGTPKLLPNAGIGLGYRIEGKWEINAEIVYHTLAFSANAKVRSQAFNTANQVFYFTGDTRTDVELRFIEFPIAVNYKLNKNWQLSFGPYFSKILEGTFHSEGKNGVQSVFKVQTDTASWPGIADPTFDFDKYIDNYDLGLFLGYKYKIGSKLFFWGRLHAGFKSIFKKEFFYLDYDLYQLRLSFGLSYTLFPGINGSKND